MHVFPIKNESLGLPTWKVFTLFVAAVFQKASHSLTHSMMKQNKSKLKVSLKQRHCALQLEYHAPVLYGMVLEVVVKSKKTFVAATNIKLEENLLDKETWFPLGNCAV